MKEEDLKRLTEKYYSGETTEDEEKILRDYFNNNVVPAGYEAEKEIFSFYSETEKIPEPSTDFESRILAGIDASERLRGSLKMKKYLLPALSAAAGILILAGSYLFFLNREETKDTFSDPALAYTETIKILRDVSSQLNHGAQILEPVAKINEVTKKSFQSINKSTRIVEKNLKSLDYLQKSGKMKQYSTEKHINK